MFLDLEISLNDTCTVTNDSMNGAPSASFDLQSIGTIEVVVLRCYPMIKPIKPALNQKFRQRVPTLVASPNTSSSGESWSDDNRSQPGLGGLFDGTDDDIQRELTLMHFGGDASWDNGQTWQQQSHSPHWNDVTTNNNTSTPGQGQAASGQWDNGVSTSCHERVDHRDNRR